MIVPIRLALCGALAALSFVAAAQDAVDRAPLEQLPVAAPRPADPGVMKRELGSLAWLPEASRGEPALRMPASLLAQATPTNPAATVSAPSPKPLEFGSGKSYTIPAYEILGFDFLLNRFNHAFSGSTDYNVTLGSVRRNLRSSWVTDNDPYQVNQFAHPYQGAMYHGFARSAGLGYWEAAGYTFAGSAAWELFGERTRPAKNDQIASGIAGSFLGEALFRMSSLVLEHGNGVPTFWREVAAAAISPSTGFNRLAYGDRFDPIFSSRGAYYYSRLQVGLSGTTRTIQGNSNELKRNEVLADYSLEYGLPGKRDYQYTRPFDYFAFQAIASSANVFESVLTRGLLVGQAYGKEHDVRGVWGLYGSYDYISPQVYRISSTALSLGTTVQRWMTDSIAVQGTAMAGAGYAAVGTLRGGPTGEYHYGAAPQVLLALRVIFGDTAALDMTAREYYVNHIASRAVGGHDNIARADISLTFRVARQHAIAIKYLWNRRDATYASIANGTQQRSTVGIFYSYIGNSGFGAVDWR
ncbi:MAG: DUF3943 domain-containing protein [Burkholderiaceae bacterium]